MPDSDPTSRLAAEFVPSPVPAIGPDGAPSLEPAPLEPLQVLPISLCTLGPCKNFHSLLSKIDATEPIDGSSGGIHLQPMRACYPAPGVEIELTAPIRECNRWAPLSSGELAERLERDTRWQRLNLEETVAYSKSWDQPEKASE